MAADLRVIETDRAAIQAEVVGLLEETLAEARDGGIVAVGIAKVRPDGAVSTARSRSDNVALLAGSTALLHHRLLRDMAD